MLQELVSVLLNGKALPPPDPNAQSVLARIMRLDVSNYNEAEVRAEIIEPLIRLLGYDVENWASLKRERAVRVVGSSKALDYSMLLFQEDFWLIEAKRPKKGNSFKRDFVYQTLRYAAHPEINAALMMICDGEKLEVYDREVSLESPLLRLPRAEWSNAFDQLRALLSPWQAFFFERRRVLRLVDKIFDQETHLERLEEFRRAVDQKLIGKRARVLENWRERVDLQSDFDAHNARLASAAPVELIETDFFVQQSVAGDAAMIANVSGHTLGEGQLIAIRIFPEIPRATSVAFWGHALHYLLESHKSGIERLLLPSWLSHDDVAASIERLVPLLLTSFRRDRDRKVVLLHSAAARRVLKLMLMIGGDAQRAGEVLHALGRYIAPELSFAQSVSSPSRHLLGVLDGQHMAASSEFVRRHTDQDGRQFAGSAAEQELRELWQAELRLLGKIPNHGALLSDRKLDDVAGTESAQMTFDALGHLALCVLDLYPDWRDWALRTYHAEVVELARNGSWQAREWLGLGREELMEPLDEQWFADRFFLGDLATAAAIRRAYRRA